jgi:Xaa-Pro aminopeptidase
MEQDGAALCEFFAWLDSALTGSERITELTIDEKLTAARERRPGYVSLSFNTIAAFNANGAMPHYHATEEEHAVIEGDGLLLIDSGGQYLGAPRTSRGWSRSAHRRPSRSAIAPVCSKA